MTQGLPIPLRGLTARGRTRLGARIAATERAIDLRIEAEAVRHDEELVEFVYHDLSSATDFSARLSTAIAGKWKTVRQNFLVATALLAAAVTVSFSVVYAYHGIVSLGYPADAAQWWQRSLGGIGIGVCAAVAALAVFAIGICSKDAGPYLGLMKHGFSDEEEKEIIERVESVWGFSEHALYFASNRDRKSKVDIERRHLYSDDAFHVMEDRTLVIFSPLYGTRFFEHPTFASGSSIHDFCEAMNARTAKLRRGVPEAETARPGFLAGRNPFGGEW